MRLPHTLPPPPAQRAVSTGVKAAIVALVALNLVQLNVQSWLSRNGACSLQQGATPISSSSQARTWNPFGKEPAAQPAVALKEPSLPAPQQHFALFVIFSWNYEVLLTSLQSYAAAGFGQRITVIDNSPGKELAADERVLGLVGEILPTRTRLTFSQAQNLIADISIEREYDYYFWGHSDVAVLAAEANASFAADVVACMEAAMSAEPTWGIMYFAYDWFSAIRTDLVRKVQYDTFITVYKSDCDFYPRCREAGFKTLNYQEVCPKEVGKVYDLNNAVEVPWDNWEAAKAILDADEAARTGRFDWKFERWGPDERVGWALWEQASAFYYMAKWGPVVDPKEVCRIEVKSERTGQEALPQQPFADLTSVQRGHWMEEDWMQPGTPILRGSNQTMAGSKAATEVLRRREAGRAAL